jgi:putative hydrolase of the HAD superfamily
MSALKAVLFDVDDTLFSTTAFSRHARGNAVRAMIAAGLDLPEEVVLRELDEVIAEFSSNYDHHFDKLIQRLRPPGLAKQSRALIVAAGIVAYHDTKFRDLAPFPDVVPLFTFLRDAGVIAGVVTHGWSIKQAEKIVRLGLRELLAPTAIFISDDIGISKPNPKLYQAALTDLGLQPGEVMYVGDNPAHDVAPPQSLGMIAVWARRAAKHGLEGTGIEPDHVVDDFVELERILREEYGVAPAR